MEQQLVIIRIEESKDGKRLARNRSRMEIPLSQLKSGAEIPISDQRKMKVVNINNDEMRFTVDQKSYVLNRYWQVLGTVKMDLPSNWADQSERFTFHFETVVDHAEEGIYEYMAEMMETMRTNSEDCKMWKNIPLAREMMHLLKDCCPLRDDEVNPIVRMSGVNAIANSNILPVYDAPRLYLSYLEYWEINNDLKVPDDGEVNNAKYFLEELDKNIDKYTWIVDPAMTSDLYDKMFGEDTSLRFDFIQLSPEWENAIYDIESETEQQVGSEYKGMGFCFEIWAAKTSKAAKHGLRWRSPHVMNPDVMFD